MLNIRGTRRLSVFKMRGDPACVIKSLGKKKQERKKKEKKKHLNKTWAALPLKRWREYLFDHGSWEGGDPDCPLKLRLVLTEAPTILEKAKGERRGARSAGGGGG